MDVEGDFFGGGGPVLVGEAVGVFAVEGGGEGVVAGGDGGFVEVVFEVGVGDLRVTRGAGCQLGGVWG